MSHPTPDVESRLRDAFAARAELVTPESVRRADPPPAPPRRIGRWAGPGLAGLAVAAAAAVTFVAVVHGPPVSAPTYPQVPGVTPTPAASRAPLPSPTGSARPAPVVPTTSSTATARPTSSGARGTQTIAMQLWTLRVPASWASVSPPGAPGTTCIGTPAQACMIRLVTGAIDEPVLGGGLVPGLPAGCRSDPYTWQKIAPGLTANVEVFHCPPGTYRQLTFAPRGMLALGLVDADPAVAPALATLRLDVPPPAAVPGTRSCTNLPLGTGIASRIRATGVSCSTADAVVTRARASLDVAKGPIPLNLTDLDAGWMCAVNRAATAPPSATVTCWPAGEGDGGKIVTTVTWTQT